MFHFTYPMSGAIVSSAGEMRPGRLWSLWDMIEVYGISLFLIGEVLKHIYDHLDRGPRDQTIIDALSLCSRHLASLSSDELSKSILSELERHVVQYYESQGKGVEANEKQVYAAILLMEKHFALLDLTVSNAMLKRISRNLRENEKMPNAGEILELSSRIKDELYCKKFIYLEPKRLRLYEPDRPLFGEAIADRFPAAVFEIDEAAKCLALGRSTAAVFHLMRLMEIGIRALARCLQIPDPVKPAERNWAMILR